MKRGIAAYDIEPRNPLQAIALQDQILDIAEGRGLLVQGEDAVHEFVDRTCRKLKAKMDPRNAWAAPTSTRKSDAAELARADGSRGFGLDNPAREQILDQIAVRVTRWEEQNPQIFGRNAVDVASEKPEMRWAPGSELIDMNSPAGRAPNALVIPESERDQLRRVKSGLAKLRTPFAADLGK